MSHYLAYTASHWSLNALPEDNDRYKGRYYGSWDVLAQDRFAGQLGTRLIDSSLAFTPRAEHITSWKDNSHKED